MNWSVKNEKLDQMEPDLYTLVTGASSGIGRAISLRLARERKLILHGRQLDRLEETRRMCERSEQHLIWQFDLKNIDALSQSLIPLLTTSNRAIDCFVHCAGVTMVLAARDVGYAAAQEVMNINFFAAAEISKVLLKKKNNGTHLANILFISSIWSRFGARGHSMYCASKAALDGLMRALAIELAPLIRVNSILPGAIHTDMADRCFADPVIAEKFKKDYPLGVGTPEDVAETVEFVLSAKARWMTGHEIVIDGGRTVNMSLK